MVKVHNFSAGPGALPKPVLEKVQKEILNYGGSGCSVMELSHRSKEFEGIISSAEKDLREIMEIPDNYHVLFMQGGATCQFSCVVYNLAEDLSRPVDYIVSGAWSEKAVAEAQKLGANVRIIASKQSDNRFDFSTAEFSPDASYIYYCSNETIHGVEFEMDPPFASSNIPIVCDMSSNILTKKIDVSKYGLIFAGAQKNIGPAGVTIVIVRKDLISAERICKQLITPIMLDYRTYTGSNSLYNTPPTFSIYVSGLVLKWIKDQGGLDSISKAASAKSKLLYDTIEKSNAFYACTVEKRFRSRINIPFRILGKDGNPSKDLEAEFIKKAEERGLIQLKGHRSVGGIRASFYNAISMESVQALVDFMNFFQQNQ